MKLNQFAVYQLKQDAQGRKLAFRSYQSLKEQGIAVRVKLKAVLDDIHQTVQLFSHICVPGAQIDLFHPGEVT